MSYRAILFKIAAGVGAILLAGCATQAQLDGRHIDEVMNAARAQGENCMSGIPIDAQVRQHYPDDLRLATLAQLTDPSKATAHEIDLLTATHDTSLPCRAAYINTVNSVNPPLAALWASYFELLDRNTVDLTQRKISWGEYVSNLQSLDDARKARHAEIMSQLIANLKAAHQQELAQRAAAAEAFSQSMMAAQQQQQQQQIINRMNRPVMTNCNRFGAQINCMSY